MVILSVRLSRSGTESSQGEIETPGFHRTIAWVSSFLWGNLVPLDEEIPLEQGHQRGAPPYEIVILPLLARLAWERLQIDRDLLLIITSTADDLSGGTNTEDRERPGTPKIGVLVLFSRFQAATHIWRVNCAITIQDRSGQPAYEMFGIKRRFQQRKVRPPRFKQSCVRVHPI